MQTWTKCTLLYHSTQDICSQSNVMSLIASYLPHQPRIPSDKPRIKFCLHNIFVKFHQNWTTTVKVRFYPGIPTHILWLILVKSCVVAQHATTGKAKMSQNCFLDMQVALKYLQLGTTGITNWAIKLLASKLALFMVLANEWNDKLTRIKIFVHVTNQNVRTVGGILCV